MERLTMNGRPKGPKRYNPFAYLHSEKDILKLVNTIIANLRATARKPPRILG